MSIAVTCHKCRSTFPVKEKYAGRQGACPVCKAVVDVPGLSTISTHAAAWVDDRFDLDDSPPTANKPSSISASSAAASSSPAGASSSSSSTSASPSSASSSAGSSASGRIEFPCESCGHRLKAEAAHVGRKIRCSACQHKFRVPATAVPVALPTRPVASPRPQPEEVIGLADEPSPVPARAAIEAPASTPVRKSFRRRLVPRPAHRDDEYFVRSAPAEQSTNDLWGELSPTDLSEGSARPTPGNPFAPGATLRRAGEGSFSNRFNFSWRIPKRLISLGGTLLFLLVITLRFASRWERAHRNDDAHQALHDFNKKSEIWDRPTLEKQPENLNDREQLVKKPLKVGEQAFKLRGAYYLPGTDPRNLGQATFVLDVEPGRVPQQDCNVVIKSQRNIGLISMRGSSFSQGTPDRLELHLYSAQVQDTGPFTAWIETAPDGFAQTIRERVSNTIAFQAVRAIPPFDPRPSSQASPARRAQTPPSRSTPTPTPRDSSPVVPRPTPAPPPLSPAEQITQALDELNSGDQWRQRRAAQALAKLEPDERREQIARSLDPLLSDADFFTRRHAAEALARWATAENLDSLIQATAANEFSMRDYLVAALATIDDQRAAQAIATQLPASSAVAALESMGPIAEPLAQQLLKSPDIFVRRAACQVLKTVGGKSSLKLLRQAGADRPTTMWAQAAYSAIQTRIEQAKRAAKATPPSGGKSALEEPADSTPASSDLPRALKRVQPADK